MSLLTPTSTGRRRGGSLPVVLAVLAALAVGLVAGWWFTGRDSTGSATPSPSSTVSCPPSTSGSPSAVALPAAKTITVNVYNATKRAGLAKTTSTQLVQRGFRAGKVANDPKGASVAASAEIRYGPKGALAAKVVAAQVAGATLVKDSRTDASVDFVIGEAYAALATPDQVAKALAAAAKPAPRPSGC